MLAEFNPSLAPPAKNSAIEPPDTFELVMM